jgi:mono/diheme cytochrome c family protein
MSERRRFAFVAVVIMLAYLPASLLLDVRYAEAQGPDTTGDGMMGRGMMGGGNIEGGMMGQGTMGQNGGSAVRHRQFMTSGVPEPYASMRDPLHNSPEVIARGRTVFEETCASCHGTRGLGNGEAGRELSPPPSNLVALTAMPMMRSDPYLYWAIAEGGAPIGTAMPAFKDTLSVGDIWSVVHFLRAGLPEADGSEKR